MNTRYLIVISLIIAFIAVWFYRSQAENDSMVEFAETNIEYEATDILAVQTNDGGNVEYMLSADKLVHYAKENTDNLSMMTLHWRPNSRKHITISSNNSTMNYESNTIMMDHNVIFVSENADLNAKHMQKNTGHSLPLTDLHKTANSPSQSNSSANTHSEAMHINAQQLIGNLTENRIYSDSTITARQNQNTFKASRFMADIDTGEYEFDKVEVTFKAPIRKDVDLF